MDKEGKSIEDLLKGLPRYAVSREANDRILKAIEGARPKSREQRAMGSGFSFWKLAFALRPKISAMVVLLFLVAGIWHAEKPKAYMEHLEKARAAVLELERNLFLIPRAAADSTASADEILIEQLIEESSSETQKAIQAAVEIRNSSSRKTALEEIRSLESKKLEAIRRASQNSSGGIKSTLEKAIAQSSVKLEEVSFELLKARGESPSDLSTKKEASGANEEKARYLSISLASSNPPPQIAKPDEEGVRLLNLELKADSNASLYGLMIQHSGNGKSEDWSGFHLYRNGVRIASVQSLGGEGGALPFRFNPPLALNAGLSVISLRGDASAKAEENSTHYFSLEKASSVDSSLLEKGGFPLRSNAVAIGKADPLCGNTILEGGEQCDDGNAIAEACPYGLPSCQICDSSCRLAEGKASYCGNGQKDILNGEQCDDGNAFSGDGCSSSCRTEASSPVCGNGALDAGELCDDGNAFSNDGCSSSCQNEAPGAVCGDGLAEGSEQCDDGNAFSNDGCSSSCQNEASGAVCGDGLAEGSEQCDDGNAFDFDGCSSICLLE